MQLLPQHLQKACLIIFGTVRHCHVPIPHVEVVPLGPGGRCLRLGQQEVGCIQALWPGVTGSIVQDELAHRWMHCQLAPRATRFVILVLVDLLHHVVMHRILCPVELRGQHEEGALIARLLDLFHDLAADNCHLRNQGRRPLRCQETWQKRPFSNRLGAEDTHRGTSAVDVSGGVVKGVAAFQDAARRGQLEVSLLLDDGRSGNAQSYFLPLRRCLLVRANNYRRLIEQQMPD
mmetsp:Transcript_88423/g.211093  ORF Transcript_88423/g.211093 Transcript_88423/m.211093 type:complete len:233 (+) Transcript_88423:434-1132(+)